MAPPSALWWCILVVRYRLSIFAVIEVDVRPPSIHFVPSLPTATHVPVPPSRAISSAQPQPYSSLDYIRIYYLCVYVVVAVAVAVVVVFVVVVVVVVVLLLVLLVPAPRCCCARVARLATSTLSPLPPPRFTPLLYVGTSSFPPPSCVNTLSVPAVKMWLISPPPSPNNRNSLCEALFEMPLLPPWAGAY